MWNSYAFAIIDIAVFLFIRQVDAEWVLRGLERWGKRDNMPFIGPNKVCGCGNCISKPGQVPSSTEAGCCRACKD